MLKILFKLFGPAVLVYAVNFLAVVSGLYGVWKWFDIPMHFLGGMAIAWLAYVAWDLGLGLYEKKVMDSIPLLIKAVSIISFATFIGVVWEWHEFIIDAINIRQMISFVPMQPGLADTMKDLLMDVLGATTFVAISTLLLRRKN